MKKKIRWTNGYKIDYEANTFTMNYKFAAAASEIGSKEYYLRKTIEVDYPQMKVIVESGREQKSPKKNKGLNYKNMKAHIGVYVNSDELMEMFDKAVELSKTSKSPYKYVCDWFKMQFPNYDNPNAIKEDLYLKPILPKEDTKKEKKEKPIPPKEEGIEKEAA